MTCINCGTQTDNPKFCSRSCAAKYNNVMYPKRKSQKKCIVCGEPTLSHRHSRCETHWLEYRNNHYKNITVGEYRSKKSLKNRHPSWKNSYIRNFARSWLKHLAELPCAMCGYNKHVELCHIKPISEFTDDTLLGDVNNEDNVIQLCPNCHWEFDHNIISIENIRSKPILPLS